MQLVQHSGLERPLRRAGALPQHVPIPGGGFRLGHRAGDPIGHVRYQGIVGGRGTGRPVTGDEDRDTVLPPPP